MAVLTPANLLVERDSELALLENAFADALAGNGTAMLLEGEAGIGKTTLLSAASANARTGGPRLLKAHGTALDQGVAYGIARQLLLPTLLDGANQDKLLRGAAALAQPALMGDEGGGAVPPEAGFAIREGLAWLVAAMAGELGPLALIVDDLHWADGPSVRFLHALAGRVEELPVALILAARPGPAWSDPGLAAELAGAVRVVCPARLTSQGVGSALAGRLQAEPADEFIGAAHLQTAGTPYLVAALADALRREGVAPTADRVSAIDRLGLVEVGRDVAARLHGLDPDARAICRAVAVLGDGRSAAEAERRPRSTPPGSYEGGRSSRSTTRSCARRYSRTSAPRSTRGSTNAPRTLRWRPARSSERPRTCRRSRDGRTPRAPMSSTGWALGPSGVAPPTSPFAICSARSPSRRPRQTARGSCSTSGSASSLSGIPRRPTGSSPRPRPPTRPTCACGPSGLPARRSPSSAAGSRAST
jgi:hypothetical protein